MEILNREFGEYKEGVVPITQTMKQTFDYDLEKKIVELRSIQEKIKNFPKQIEKIKKQEKEHVEYFNKGLDLLEELVEKYDVLKETGDFTLEELKLERVDLYKDCEVLPEVEDEK